MTSIFWQELGRKIIHLIILLVLILYVIIEKQFGKTSALLVLVALLIVFLILEYFRLELDWRMPLFSELVRDKERHKVYGVVYFISATIICLAVFDFRIAIAALLMTTFGDVAAALIGKKYGVTLIFRDKTAIGGLSELLVNLIVGFIVLSNVYIIITMAFTATIVELLVSELDDNLMVPLFTGFAGQLITFLF